MQLVIAVSSLVSDVAIPLLAAGITAAGIVVPLWVQRQRDRKAEADTHQKALRSIHRDAAFLAEQVQLVAVRHKQKETVSAEDVAVAMSASARLFSRLFDDPRVFDSYFYGPGKPEIASESKLLLLLGEFEARIKRLATPQGTWLTIFAADLVTYFGEENEQQRDDLRGALRLLVEQDREGEVRTFGSEIFPDLV